MSDTPITVTGNVGWPPNRRVLASGTVVTDFRMASTPRRFDKTTGEWRNLETLWFTVTCWRGLADNVAASIEKGDRVVVTGRLQLKSWLTKEGEQRSGLEIDAAAVGFDLARGPVQAVRPERKADRLSADDMGDDPWATPDADPLTGEVSPAPQHAAA